ncbi:MAG TPA: CIA30 family protein [Candidatus Dormibacteraeota bacterium]|nr:CIA30 family protein [Candidatus Dormibacteraeota bacterium]
MAFLKGSLRVALAFATSSALAFSPVCLTADAAAQSAPVAKSDAASSPAESNSFVVRGALIFDGLHGIEGEEVWVEDGKIKAVGKHLKTPDGIHVVDGQGDTLLPGLIDSHTHAWSDALKQALAFGVTTELDMFSDVKFDAAARSMEAGGKNHDAADLRSAGTLVTVEKGHGTEYGIKIPVLGSAPEAQAFVDARLAEGSDYIKIVYDDGRAYNHPIPTLTKEEMAAVVKAAHNRHKLAVVHIGSEAGAIDTIEAGADGLAHTFEDAPPTPEFVKLAKKHHVFVIPTLTVNESVAGTASGASLVDDTHLGPYIDLQSAANLKKGFGKHPGEKVDFANALASVAALHKAGVPILAGTDAPNPGTAHGVSIHRELELLVRAGLTPNEALAAATSVPAKTFGLNDRGRIAPGLRADLLLVKGNPMQNVTATRNIAAIWKTGFEENREPFLRAAEKEKQEEAAAKTAAPPSGLSKGLISDFEDGTTKTQFGAGFDVSTDGIAGGKSTAEIKVIEGGPTGSKRALQITGNISSAFTYAWAGAMFFPGTAPMTPANLSSKKSLHFWTHGDGRTYRVMVFTKSGGYMPAQKAFATTPDWTEIVIPLSEFGGTDGHDITGILFSAGSDPGAFVFAIDNVKLE